VSELAERFVAIRREGRHDQVAPGLEREHAPPALGRERVAGLVHDREREIDELAVQGIAEDGEVHERKEHRRDDEHRLPPQRQVRALADGEDPEQRESGPPRDPAGSRPRDLGRSSGRFRATAHVRLTPFP